MKKRLSIFIFALLGLIFIGSYPTTQLKGTNNTVESYEIPLYLKAWNFYQRHLAYKKISHRITHNASNDQEIVLSIAKWVNSNIKPRPPNTTIIDHHPLTIIERGMGSSDQFSDIYTVLLVYKGIDAFYLAHPLTNQYPLSFVKIKQYWTVIDPFKGRCFLNNQGELASIKELKEDLWQEASLDKEILYSNHDETPEFDPDINEASQQFYQDIFDKMPDQLSIENTPIFERGGRSYYQSPWMRIRYQIYKLQQSL